ncbi:hypothetical protein [Parabacteroides sp.]|uniref:hypothetical protein n=1 Tax=Parabacteroides sp. TaxID=1869337 RepID=UPI0029100B5B|nr:hypothetical protein [Parabacteroides sp.]MDU7626941.1 hypothetical protein [Parabacteroides sp.]
MNRGTSKIFLVDKIVRTAFTEAATRLLNAFSSSFEFTQSKITIFSIKCSSSS